MRHYVENGIENHWLSVQEIVDHFGVSQDTICRRIGAEL